MKGARRYGLDEHSLFVRSFCGSIELLSGMNLNHLASLLFSGFNALSMFVILRLDEKLVNRKLRLDENLF
jgi:hypothetical protein